MDGWTPAALYAANIPNTSFHQRGFFSDDSQTNVTTYFIAFVKVSTFFFFLQNPVFFLDFGKKKGQTES